MCDVCVCVCVCVCVFISSFNLQLNNNGFYGTYGNFPLKPIVTISLWPDWKSRPSFRVVRPWLMVSIEIFVIVPPDWYFLNVIWISNSLEAFEKPLTANPSVQQWFQWKLPTTLWPLLLMLTSLPSSLMKPSLVNCVLANSVVAVTCKFSLMAALAAGLSSIRNRNRPLLVSRKFRVTSSSPKLRIPL